MLYRISSLRTDNPVSVSADFASEYYCLTVHRISSPQNFSVGICVAMNQRCFELDFNEKYIIITKADPIFSDLDLEYQADIRLYSFSTLEVVRTLDGAGAGHLIGNVWHLLGYLIVVGCDDNKKIRLYC